MNPEGETTKQEGDKEQKQQAQFDPNKTPVDLDVAINHAKSKRIGFVGSVHQLDPVKDICPCCGNVISKYEVDLNVNLTDLGFLGSGVPLYFFFIKFCVTFLFLIGLISSIYNIVINSKGSACKSIPNCNADAFSNKLGVTNRDDPLDKIDTTAGLNLLCTVCLIISSLILRRRMRNLNTEIDIDNVTPSDFTIMVTNIPKSCTDAEILDYFQKRTKNFPNMKIEKIVQAYDISFYIEKKRLKQSLAAQKIKEQSHLKKLALDESEKLKEINAQIAEVDITIEQQESSMSQDSFLSCGTAFVTFSTDVGCQRVVKMFNKGIIHTLMSYVLESNKLKGNVLRVRRAPEPTDIYWENLCYTRWDRFRSMLITYFLSAVILTGCFFIIYGISIGQNDLSESSGDSVGVQILGLVISLCIFFINSGISIMIKKFALYEKHQTLTNYYIAVALKSGIAQFLNTTIIVYIVKRIKWDSRIFASGGLLSSLNFLMLMNFVFLFSYLWNPWTIMKLLKRRQLKSIGSAAQANTPQYKAHEIFEGNKFDFAQNFAKIIKILMFASFYAYAYPLLIYISLGTVIVAYWIDKYYLLRICSIPDMLSQALPYAMSDFFLELFIVIFNVGNLVFEKLLYDKQNGMTIAALVLSVIFWVFSFESIGECMDCIIHGQTQPIKEYSAYSYQFLTDYERTNPITAMRAIEEWQKKLKDQKIGNEQSQQLAMQRKQTALLLSNYALNRPGLNFNNRGLFMPQFMQSPMAMPFNNPYNRMPTMRRQQPGYLPQQNNNMMIQAPQQQHNGGYQVFPAQPLQNQPLLNNPASINIELTSLQNAQQSLRTQLCNTYAAMEALQFLNQLERNEQRIKYLQMQLQVQQAATAAANNISNGASIVVNPIQPENPQASYVQAVPNNPLGQVQQQQQPVIIPQPYQQPQIQVQQQMNFQQPVMVVQPQQQQNPFGFQPVGYVQQPQPQQMQMAQGVMLPGFQQQPIGFQSQGFQQVQQPMYQQQFY